MERARAIPATGRFILVDVATQRLWMYENGRPIDSMKVIVGMTDLPTPLIASMIHYATYNPYWNVPDHLVRKTVAPRYLKDGNAYFKSQGYQVMSDWSDSATVMPASEVDWKAVAAGEKMVRVRQLPGPTNAMGKVKFSFPNGEGIYLHDTPGKELFAKDQRTLSNGCVRVEDAMRLGRWMLGHDPVAPSRDPEQFEALPQGVPIYITYLTAQPADGALTFADDVYGWDKTPPRRVAALLREQAAP
jgi:murein L,D-transpeptidase YcbB/YkuD